MKTYTDWLREWLYEGKRALPLLHEWLDALVARDAPRIDALNARLTSVLERLENARQAVAQIPERDALPTDLLLQAMATAQAIDAVAQTAYDIIRNELDYTHGMMAILTRAAEPDHYAPTIAAPNRTNVLLNTEA